MYATLSHSDVPGPSAASSTELCAPTAAVSTRDMIGFDNLQTEGTNGRGSEDERYALQHCLAPKNPHGLVESSREHIGG